MVANIVAVLANEDPDLIRYHGDAKALALGLSPSGHHSAPISQPATTYYSPPPKIELPSIPYNPPAIPYNPPEPIYHNLVPLASPVPASAPPPCVHPAPAPLFTPSFVPISQYKQPEGIPLGVTYAAPAPKQLPLQGYKVTEGLSGYRGIAVRFIHYAIVLIYIIL